MSQKPNYENLYSFLAGEFAEADFEGKSDQEVVLGCNNPELAKWHRTIIAEGRVALASRSFPWKDVGDYANRHFETEESARKWLTEMLDLLESGLDKVSGGE
ncbi:MAG: hypothetical protein F6K63_27140 [Moorea sp. SIO1G6]|uniref:Uncharacterized protein n=2 Tax=Moorena TaxID=1155738 RepID=A0A1D9G8Y6_MOOP1|nr:MULTISPECIES: hypothetical protein [Moorena]AOY84078.1 hypothetical protein BJP36_33285 [Moorena producens JHB]NET67867.1 hypothetical protein [Moorena sp. SIO1G6]